MIVLAQILQMGLLSRETAPPPDVPADDSGTTINSYEFNDAEYNGEAA